MSYRDYTMYTQPVLESVGSNGGNSILLEYYAGKSKELLKCEDYLREIIRLVTLDHEHPANIVRKRHVYRDSKVCKELDSELTKFFKFNKVNIYWVIGSVSAETLSGNAITGYGHYKDYTAGKNINMTVSILMYEELIYYAKLNERELLAVLLHEIGHNVYFFPLETVIVVILLILTLPGSLIDFITKQIVNFGATCVIDFVQKYCPWVINVAEGMAGFWQHIQSIFGIPLGIASRFHFTPKVNLSVSYDRSENTVLVDPEVKFEPKANIIGDRGPVGVFTYGDEIGADSFATKYGYGPELITALKKMDHPEGLAGEKLAKKFGTMGSITQDIADISFDIIDMLAIEPHPNLNQRARRNLDKLKKDLKRGDYPPELRKDLESEIERMETAYKTVNDISYGNNNIQVKKTYYAIIDAVFHGHSDIREILSPLYASTTF